eukprot:TRINITY_DN68976_c0_g1_i1.p1 TRINITY_DN68976_c0_g1~~TRINITY_DN68976_c0_g1_i1.p1  ORF type:complete len:263 (-),score=35.34 TRINITY_DN68976_c0_g1_i1:160-873(-)
MSLLSSTQGAASAVYFAQQSANLISALAKPEGVPSVRNVTKALGTFTLLCRTVGVFDKALKSKGKKALSASPTTTAPNALVTVTHTLGSLYAPLESAGWLLRTSAHPNVAVPASLFDVFALLAAFYASLLAALRHALFIRQQLLAADASDSRGEFYSSSQYRAKAMSAAVDLAGAVSDALLCGAGLPAPTSPSAVMVAGSAGASLVFAPGRITLRPRLAAVLGFLSATAVLKKAVLA